MKVDYEIEIGVSPKQLWPWLVDTEKQSQWMYGVESNEIVEGDGRSVGSKFTMSVKEGSRLSEYTGTIARYDEPTNLDVDFLGGCGKQPLAMQVRYVLAPSGGGTRLRYELDSECKGFFMRLMTILFFFMPKMMVKKFMKKLKRVAEAAAAGS